ncbi:UPF0193 protein EVG1 homolog [Zophobas morio]|uniref:UPF0193 protein EVG1 homolog n=1 Tax=Zophobas morio TaxID=2755281 RepID=UPI0030830961
MEWPSKNISHGGILHPAKTTYSPETHQLLRVLMEESKMSMQQRKKMNYYLRNGEPLPLPTSRSSGQVSSRKKLPLVVIRPGSSKRRSRDMILKSGAYEREKYIPREPPVDREKEKSKLQNKMAFGKEVKPKSKPKIEKMVEKNEVEVNRFDELVNEIKEREEWLRQMEKLGEGKKHQFVIQQQIQARIREMQQLKLADSKNKEP